MSSRHRSPILPDADPDDIAFRREGIHRLDTGVRVGEEWLLDHRLPTHTACWLPTVLALVERVPRATLPDSVWVSVNADSGLLAHIQLEPAWEILSRRCWETGRPLVIEWTEKACSGEMAEKATNLLSRLQHRYGLAVAIDDMGSPGMDGFWRLSRVEPQWVKIDGPWFRRAVSGDARQREGIAIAIELVRRLGAETIVEWIETPEDRLLAQSLGARFGQGFLWSKERKDHVFAEPKRTGMFAAAVAR